MRCPVCGGLTGDAIDMFVTCLSCRELLSPNELVSRKTRATRRAYAQANGHSLDYGKRKGNR